MIELKPQEFRSARAVFGNVEHSVALVQAVLEGNSPGRVFVDRKEAPTSAYLLHEGAFHYVAGSTTSSSFNNALDQLIFRKLLPDTGDSELVLFAFSEAWRTKLDELLGTRGAIRIHRKRFTFSAPRYAVHQGCRDRLPSGVSVQAIDSHWVQWRPELEPITPTRTRRFGTGVVVDNEMVSVCSAIAVGKGHVEIDIHTNEDHRKKGYAFLAAHAFIEECLARGLRPNWSCWPEREASCSLARKLGFVDEPDLPAHFWATNM